jgi:hypothetical protein
VWDSARVTSNSDFPVTAVNQKELDGRIVSSYCNVITTFKDVSVLSGPSGPVGALRLDAQGGAVPPLDELEKFSRSGCPYYFLRQGSLPDCRDGTSQQVPDFLELCLSLFPGRIWAITKQLALRLVFEADGLGELESIGAPRKSVKFFCSKT